MPGKRLYFYPMSGRNKPGEGNPYSGNLIRALDTHFRVVNRKDPSRNGIINLLKYINRTDILFLNWVEDLPDRKHGYLQTLAFFLMFTYLRWRKAEICWILHNKFSHYKKNRWLKSFLFRFLATRCTRIITHSEEGLEYIRHYDPGHRNQIIFFHHPIIPRRNGSEC